MENDDVIINLVTKINVDNKFWCNEAVLIEVVNGKCKLRNKYKRIPDGYYGERSLKSLYLNEIPLVHLNVPYCPTCKSMIATGYGINNTDTSEIKEIMDKLNSDYTNISDAIENIKPILGLLRSGLYVIADTISYPTDGNGNFFWDTNNEMTENSATGAVFTKNFELIEDVPMYIYPTQGTICFNEERVDYYTEKYKSLDTFPRAITYYSGQFLSSLIDGHHKATAMALKGKQIPCTTIIPISYFSEGNNEKSIHFADFEIDNTMISEELFSKHYDNTTLVEDLIKQTPADLVKHKWSEKYLATSKFYPSVKEIAEVIALDWDINNSVSEEQINNLLNDENDDSFRILQCIVEHLSRIESPKLKNIAFKCGNAPYPPLKKSIFEALIKIKNDEEVERFFIDYLEIDKDMQSILREIADSYWD